MAKFGTKDALFGYFWPRMPNSGIFGQEFKKNYCHIWNYHPQICLIGKFHEKTKMCDLSIFGLEFENNIVIFEISTLEIV